MCCIEAVQRTALNPAMLTKRFQLTAVSCLVYLRHATAGRQQQYKLFISNVDNICTQILNFISSKSNCIEAIFELLNANCVFSMYDQELLV